MCSTCSSRRITLTISPTRVDRRSRPYDNAGYTLAFQMGVQFDRILDGFDCPCQPIAGLAEPPAGTVASSGAAGYLLSPQHERRVHRGEPRPQGRQRRVLAQEPDERERQVVSGGDVLHRVEGRHDRRCCRRSRRRRDCRSTARRRSPGSRRAQAAAQAHRAVGSVRRLDAVRSHPLAVRAVRVPVHRSCIRRRSTPGTCRRSTT